MKPFGKPFYNWDMSIRRNLFMLLNRSVPDVRLRRENWQQHIPENQAKPLVFLDESGINTNMTRRYARAKKNQRAVDSTPLNTPATTTILSSIRLDGSCVYTTYQGGTTAERFESYLESDLLPTLSPDDIIVMDNMRSHHAKVVKNLLDEKHIQYLYLPPYSPDYNPIENMWSKITANMRK